MKNKILLASSSPYRAALLTQLGFCFDTYSPNIDEAPIDQEGPQALALRLSNAKAQKAHMLYPTHIVIASDQVACIAGSDEPIGKPGTSENAIKQLSSYSGKTLHFYTGLCVIVPDEFINTTESKDNKTSNVRSVVEQFNVSFRQLSLEQIKRYVELEQALDCAGSFKAEGLGIHLFSKFEGRDHNSLIGLPLMSLIDILKEFGLDTLPLVD